MTEVEELTRAGRFTRTCLCRFLTRLATIAVEHIHSVLISRLVVTGCDQKRGTFRIPKKHRYKLV